MAVQERPRTVHEALAAKLIAVDARTVLVLVSAPARQMLLDNQIQCLRQSEVTTCGARPVLTGHCSFCWVETWLRRALLRVSGWVWVWVWLSSPRTLVRAEWGRLAIGIEPKLAIESTSIEGKELMGSSSTSALARGWQGGSVVPVRVAT